jgi:hypothetical protein
MYCSAGSFNGLIHIPDPRPSWSPISSAKRSDPTGWLEQSAWAFVVKARVSFDPVFYKLNHAGFGHTRLGTEWEQHSGESFSLELKASAAFIKRLPFTFLIHALFVVLIAAAVHLVRRRIRKLAREKTDLQGALRALVCVGNLSSPALRTRMFHHSLNGQWSYQAIKVANPGLPCDPNQSARLLLPVRQSLESASTVRKNKSLCDFVTFLSRACAVSLPRVKNSRTFGWPSRTNLFGSP